MKTSLFYISLLLVLFVLFIANLVVGSVTIPFGSVLDILMGSSVDRESWTIIVLESRLPQAITALFVGAALSVSGLLLQTCFRNPLADSSILGITSGASLGVALVVMLFSGVITSQIGNNITGSLAVILGAFLGSASILFIILAVAKIVQNNVMLLIIGIMLAYICSSLITLLSYQANSDKIYTYVMWGMGDFSGVSLIQLPQLVIGIAVGLCLAILLIKPLNALLLGNFYAANLGVNIKKVRFLLLLSAGMLTAVATAFCGPIVFIGLSVPHIARLLTQTSNHKNLLPTSLLLGALVALLCNVFSSHFAVPLNAITPILGAPVIIYVIIFQKKIQY